MLEGIMYAPGAGPSKLGGDFGLETIVTGLFAIGLVTLYALGAGTLLGLLKSARLALPMIAYLLVQLLSFSTSYSTPP